MTCAAKLALNFPAAWESIQSNGSGLWRMLGKAEGFPQCYHLPSQSHPAPSHHRGRTLKRDSADSELASEPSDLHS